MFTCICYCCLTIPGLFETFMLVPFALQVLPQNSILCPWMIQWSRIYSYIFNKPKVISHLNYWDQPTVEFSQGEALDVYLVLLFLVYSILLTFDNCSLWTHAWQKTPLLTIQTHFSCLITTGLPLLVLIRSTQYFLFFTRYYFRNISDTSFHYNQSALLFPRFYVFTI